MGFCLTLDEVKRKEIVIYLLVKFI